jgi:hypothetical protein
VVRLRKQAQKRRKVKQIEQLQQTLMLNPHIPSRKEENAQKLKQNEFFASHARLFCSSKSPSYNSPLTLCWKIGNHSTPTTIFKARKIKEILKLRFN